jgi:NADH-quinone oxidoreductase subunit J
MTLPDLLFYGFAFGLLAGGGLVVGARNPMVGVLGMLLAFLNASGLFILAGAEFLGLLLIMIYMGAIMVMFLFVVMTIDIDFVRLREKASPYLPLGIVVAGALAVELALAATRGNLPQAQAEPYMDAPANIVQLGDVMFTAYALPFEAAGLILLVAMVGAIVLTHRPRGQALKQNIGAQIMRNKAEVMQLTQPKVGAGATAKHWALQSVKKRAGGSHE